MRSFFRRPSWASRGIEDSAPDFYRRSEQTYADIIAATKEAREKSAIDFAGNDQTENGKASKCRRTSNQVCVGEATSSEKVAGVISDQYSSIISDPGSHSVLQEKREDSLHQMQRMGSTNKGDTVHDYNTSALGHGPVGIQSNGQVNEHCDNSSSAAPSTHKDTNNVHGDEPASENADNRKIDYQAIQRDKSVQDDVVVQILITSEIENTKPLIVHRKASQSLREVRLAWCKRQGFSEKLQSSVFLTWKGRRLFDVTTCRSLGVNAVNNLDGIPDFNFSSVDGGPRVHMEAVTDDLSISKQGRRQLSQASPTTESQTGPESADTENEKRGLSMKIILRCPGLDDFGTRVSQKTRISHIISAFKDAQQIPAGKHIYLLFDGDRLDPNACLLDYDIADQDMVDVLIK